MALGWLCDSTLNTTARPSPMSTAPAFSPGPWSTRSPLVGSRRSSGFEVLYEQCSDQSTPTMPSSTSLGSRPSLSTSTRYSVLVSATSRSLRSETARLTPGCSPDQHPRARGQDRLEEQPAVRAAQVGVGAALRVRHHPQHVAALVHDPGDAVEGAVRIGRRHHRAVLVAVAKDHLAALL